MILGNSIMPSSEALRAGQCVVGYVAHRSTYAEIGHERVAVL